MRTLLWLLGVGIAAGLIANGSLIASAAARNIDNGKVAVEQDEYVFKAAEDLFTGTVVTNDLKDRTIMIDGHNPLRRETVERFVARDKVGRAKLKEKMPVVRETTRTFQVDPLCCVSLTNNASAQIADIEPGAAVDVEYRKVLVGTNSTLVASAIRPAAKHPYDLPSTTVKPKKK